MNNIYQSACDDFYVLNFLPDLTLFIVESTVEIFTARFYILDISHETVVKKTDLIKSKTVWT